jgi:hypothetical protein
MMTKAKQLGNLETVAGLEAEISYSHQVLLAEQIRSKTTYTRQGALEPSASSQPPARRPPLPLDNWQAVHQEAEALTDAMAEQMSRVRAFIEQMHESLHDMFDRFRDRVAAWDPSEPAGPDLIGKMYEDLMAKASQLA